MNLKANTVEEYLKAVPEERQSAFNKLRETIKSNIPDGFQECLNYGMIGYVVPHSIYKAGYHVNSDQPLPFCNIASQKNFIALYHSGIYASPEIHDWFVTEFEKVSKYKLDMGKSCVRFKKIEAIPYELIAQLMKKLSVAEWVEMYEEQIAHK